MSVFKVLYFGGLLVGGGLMTCGAGVYGYNALYPTFAASLHTLRTVQYFKEHRSELKVEYGACQNNPGMAMLDPECENAVNAKQSLDLEDVISRYEAAGVGK